MYFEIMAGSSCNATERASSAASFSESSQIVCRTQTTSSIQTSDFTDFTSSSSLRLVNEFRKPDFIVFVNYEDDPHENNGKEEEDNLAARAKDSDEDKEGKEINEENEEINKEEEEGGEEETDKEAASESGMWDIRRFEAKVHGREIASLWEIKPFYDDMFFMSTNALKKRVEFIMDQTLTQIQTQVQFAFTEFPHQDKISAFCIVGLYWRAMDFRRDQMPTLPKSKLSDPNYSAENVDFIPCRTTAVYPLFNKSQTDYHTEFKKNWTLSCKKFLAFKLSQK